MTRFEAVMSVVPSVIQAHPAWGTGEVAAFAFEVTKAVNELGEREEMIEAAEMFREMEELTGRIEAEYSESIRAKNAADFIARLGGGSVPSEEPQA